MKIDSSQCTGPAKAERLVGLFLGLVASSFGCGCGGETDTSPTGGSPDVVGTHVDTYLTEGGRTERPNDADPLTISALVPEAGGGFTTFPGKLAADGTFTIPGVPTGEFYLQRYPRSFVVTTERELALGALFGGRPDAAPITTPTPLHVSATGLQAWQDSDALELFALGADAWGPLTSPMPPTAGDTSLAGFTVDCADLYVANLINGEKGDQAYLTHLVTHALPGMGYYTSIGEALTPAPFTQHEGQGSTMAGAFVPASPQHATFAFQRSQFDALIALAHPDAMFSSHDLFAYAEPAGKTEGSATAPPTIFDATDTESGDVTLEIDYGDPFPPAWGVVVWASTSYRVALNVPWSGYPSTALGGVLVAAPLDALAAGPVTPVVGPPSNLLVNDESAHGDRTGIGTSPTITWTAPALGKPEAYVVTVYEVQEGQRRTATHIITTGVSVRVPPGLLKQGSLYYVKVTAQTGYDPKNPYATSQNYNYAYADALSGLLSP